MIKIEIRTPWTLSSDKVWEKTHRKGSILFKFAGIIIFCGMFFERYVIIFILLPIILISFYTIIYSYFEYKKEKRQNNI